MEGVREGGVEKQEEKGKGRKEKRRERKGKEAIT